MWMRSWLDRVEFQKTKMETLNSTLWPVQTNVRIRLCFSATGEHLLCFSVCYSSTLNQNSKMNQRQEQKKYKGQAKNMKT